MPLAVFADDDYVVIEGERRIFARLEFEVDDMELTPASENALAEIAPMFSDGVTRRYEVHGHFCSGVEGSRRNALMRTETVFEWLVASGVSDASVTTVLNVARQERGRGGECAGERRVDIMSIDLRRELKKPVVSTTQTQGVAWEIAAPRRPPASAPPLPAAAQNRQTVAVYMAGEEPQAVRGVHNILGGELVRVISANEKFLAVDRTDFILEQLVAEHEYQRSGMVDDDQIKDLGRQLGVQYLCISNIIPVGDGYYIDTRLVDVVTAEVARSITATSGLRDANEKMRVARDIAHELVDPGRANRCGQGADSKYDPAYQFCFGGKAYNFCGGSGYNPQTQGCIAGREIGTLCADGSVVTLGTHCGQHTLSVAVAPANGGTITRAPDAQAYRADAKVALSATANRGFQFAGWAGAQSSTDPAINVTMTRDMPVIAMFRPLNNNTLITTAFPNNGGTITRTPESNEYQSGEVITVTATPNRGYEFVGWEGAASSSNATVKIMMDEGKALVAIFRPNLHTLSATAMPDFGGSVFINGTALTEASSSEFGNMVVAFARPASGYVFTGWSGGAAGTVNPVSVDISKSNVNIIANFAPQQRNEVTETRIVAVSSRVESQAQDKSGDVVMTPAPNTSTAITIATFDTTAFIETVNGVSFAMIAVNGGTFTMGCTPEQGSDCFSNESPAHQVTLSDYYIGEFEVTQRLWDAVMGVGNNPSRFKGDELPVERVSWNDVKTFIATLNLITGKNYRLPSEAEWEYAARGGSHSRGFKYSGSNDINTVAWYSGNSNSRNKYNFAIRRSTQPVGTKQPNELGIYDMSGNVWEWVDDWYGTYTNTAEANLTNPTRGSVRVNRGGSWNYNARNARVSYRYFNSPDERLSDVGFRLALSP